MNEETIIDTETEGVVTASVPVTTELSDTVEVSFEQEIENEIIAKNLTAPRVTKGYIDKLFAEVVYTNMQVAPTRVLCQATLGGFSLADGFAACVSVENFDFELGCKLAQKKAEILAHDKLWELEGYLLSRSLNETPATI